MCFKVIINWAFILENCSHHLLLFFRMEWLDSLCERDSFKNFFLNLFFVYIDVCFEFIIKAETITCLTRFRFHKSFPAVLPGACFELTLIAVSFYILQEKIKIKQTTAKKQHLER